MSIHNLLTIDITAVLREYEEKLVGRIVFLSISIFLLFPCIVGFYAVIHPAFSSILSFYSKISDMAYPMMYLSGTLIFCIKLIAYGKAFVDSIKNSTTKKIFILLILWMMISSGYNISSGWYFSQGAILRETVWMQISYFLVFFMLGTLINDKRAYKLWLIRENIIVSIFLVLVAFYLWQNELPPDGMADWGRPFEGIFTNQNYYGYYLVVSIMLCAGAFVMDTNHAWRIIAFCGLIANTIALAVNDTMGAWVAGVFGVIFQIVVYYIINHKINRSAVFSAAIFVVTLILAGMFFGTLINNVSSLGNDMFLVIADEENAANAGSGRWHIWKQCISLISENPLFGIGMSGISVRMLVDYVGNPRPHNEFLQYALFYGIPAGILYIAGCFSVFLQGLKYKDRLDGATITCLVAAFGYLVSSFFGITLYSTTPYLFICLGLAFCRE